MDIFERHDLLLEALETIAAGRTTQTGMVLIAQEALDILDAAEED